jgi:diadenosine tetraphosphatase ApaH/serine/threonine PP2A family protein phosphatase
VKPIAIISDIHGNLEALEAVLDDIYAKNITDIICLGDIIGYGPNPLECVDLSYNFNKVILGNHEEAILFGAVGFNPKAKLAIDWTRDQLNRQIDDKDMMRKRWNFLGEMQTSIDEGDLLWVHGSPREPTREYLFQTDVRDDVKMRKNFEHVKRISFCGHTHSPGIFTPSGFKSPSDVFNVYLIGEEKAIINIGSVGQPRDGDVRACYVTFDGKSIVFRRVDYDVDKTVEKILAVKELPPYLGMRLKEGR